MDLIEEFQEWYRGPDGKARWIATAESVEAFLARAFMAGQASRDRVQEPYADQGRPFVRDGVYDPQRLPAPPPLNWRSLPRDGGPPPARTAFIPVHPVRNLSDYTITSSPAANRAGFEGAQDPAMRLQPGQEGEWTSEETMTWPRHSPTAPFPPGPGLVPPSSGTQDPEEATDGTS